MVGPGEGRDNDRLREDGQAVASTSLSSCEAWGGGRASFPVTNKVPRQSPQGGLARGEELRALQACPAPYFSLAPHAPAPPPNSR